MMDSAKADSTRTQIELDLPAPIEDVFAAWTKPEMMGQWLSPVGHAEVEAEVRVGGRFSVVMVGGGRRIEHTGESLSVDPPRYLSFTWQSPYTGSEPSIVNVTLTGEGETTHLLLVHERLPEGAADSHRGGWGAMLERLVAQLRMLRPDASEESG